MPNTNLTIRPLREAMLSSDPIEFQEGQWRPVNSVWRKVTWNLKDSDTQTEKYALEAIHFLDRLEKEPIRFYPKGKRNYAYTEQKTRYRQISSLVQKILQVFPKESDSEVKAKLKYRMSALDYRLEGINGGKGPTQTSSGSIRDLEMLARQWKARQHQLHPKVKKYSTADRHKLEQLLHYPDLILLLESNKGLRERFLKWTFLYGNNVPEFAKFPATVLRVKNAYLSYYIGLKEKSDLTIEKRKAHGFEEKVPTLLFQGKRMSLLDESQTVTFKDREVNRVASLKEILDSCSKSKVEPGDFRYFPHDGGMRHFNTYRWGSKNEETGEYDSVDTAKPNWWIDQLPVQQVMTGKEVKQFFGKWIKEGEYKKCFLKGIDDGHWVLAPRATRSSNDSDIKGCHAYQTFAIPVEKDQYRIYSFGKYPESFPVTLWGEICSLFIPKSAVYQCGDDNDALPRQHLLIPQTLPAEHGEIFMKIQAEIIQRSLERNEPFILPSEGCSTNVQKDVFEELERRLEKKGADVPLVIPQFEGKILDCTPKGIVRVFIAFVNWLPSWLRKPVMSSVFFLLGGWKSMTVPRGGELVEVSYYRGEYWNEKKASIPSFIYKNKPEFIIDV